MAKNKSEILNVLIKKLCAKEGGKTQLNAGQARQVVNKIVQLVKADDEFSKQLFSYLIGVKIDSIEEVLQERAK